MSRLQSRFPAARLVLKMSLVLFFVSLTPGHTFAVDSSKSVIVMFEPNVMILPAGVSQCSFDSAAVTLTPVDMIFQAHGASVVAALVPDFEQADTVGTTRLGVQYQITNWSRCFVVELSSEADVDSLIANLEGIEGVVYAEPAAVETVSLALPYAYPSPCIDDEVFAVGDQWQFQNFGLDAGGQLSPGTADADIDLVEAKATVGLDRVLAVGLVGNKNVTGSSVVGTASFRVLRSDSLVLDEEDFAPVISDILLQSGTEGPMSASRNYGTRQRLENSLGQNFPNPFNPETTIRYSLKEAANVTLTVYDVAGRKVRDLFNGYRPAGAYRIAWDARDAKGSEVSSGVYFYRLVAGSFTGTKKMMILK